ncbi:MAG: hypothetical protein FAZ92_00607 [Accumulibacter sp.]|nr:MAG: hypothetical protein FAZ92_00607 [Accumulibacter sp.]
MLELLDDLLDAGDRDVHVRHRRAHATVALVLDQAQRAGLGNGEVDSRETDLGCHELLTQHRAADADQLVDRFGVAGTRHLVGEQAGDLLLRLVDRRHDDVRRLLAIELDDVLAHVTLERLHAGIGHRMIELDLLADHRLALDHQFRRVPTGDVDDDPVRLVRGFGPVHADAVLAQPALEQLEQFRQARQTVLADLFGERALTLEGSQIGKLRRPLADQEVHRAAKAAAQVLVGNRLGRALAELAGGNEAEWLYAHGSSSSSSSRTISSFGPCAP